MSNERRLPQMLFAQLILISRLTFCVAVTLLLLLSGSSFAQSSANLCEASRAVKDELEQVEKLGDSDLPYKQKHEQQLTALSELLKKYPNDLFVRRRYQNQRRSGFFFDRDAVLAAYTPQMERNPDDPTAIYLYARLLVGRQTKEAIALLEKLVKQTPDFPWSYFELAQIYNYPNFNNATQLQGNLKNWFAKCPAGPAGFYLLSRTGDKEM